MIRADSRPVRTGRPRNQEIDRAVLETTIGLLAERGFHGVSMEDIASRAHTGKDTLYRRWPSKRHLVNAALEHLKNGAVDASAMGSAEEDFGTYLLKLDRLVTMTPFGQIFASSLGEAERDTALANWLATFWRDRRTEAARFLESPVDNGSGARGSLDRQLDMLFGSLLYRWFIERRPVSERYVRELVNATAIHELPHRGLTRSAPP